MFITTLHLKLDPSLIYFIQYLPAGPRLLRNGNKLKLQCNYRNNKQVSSRPPPPKKKIHFIH